MRNFLLALSAFVVLLLVSTEALARSPVVYNFKGNEIGVIQGFTRHGVAIMLPSVKTLGMGTYDVVLARGDLRRRARGGWETDLNNDQLAYLPPASPRRFWIPSGD